MSGCNKCEVHSAHEEMLKSHKERLDRHDIEFRDTKTAMKLKISRWVFILALGVCVPIFGFQLTALNKIDKKLAVLYDRQEQNAKNKISTTLTKHPDNKSCLVLAENQHI